MPWYMILVNIVLILSAIVVVVAVLMQEGSRQGLGTIGGAAETFFGKSKGRSYEGKLELITKIGVSVFILLAITMTAYNAHNGISNTSVVDFSQAPSVKDILDEKTRLQGDGGDTTLPVVEATETPAETTTPDASAEVTTAPEATVAVETPVVTPAPATEAPAIPTEAPAVATEAPATTVAPAA